MKVKPSQFLYFGLLLVLIFLSYFAYRGGIIPTEDSQAYFPNNLPAVDMLGQLDWSQYPLMEPSWTEALSNGGASRFGGERVYAVEVDTTNHRLYVADFNFRILVYNLNTDNTITDRVADYVLGQPNFNDISIKGISQNAVNTVGDLLFDSSNNYLYVSQSSWGRVVIYDVATITDNEDAINVLGHADFVTAGGSLSQDGLVNPMGLALDSTNHRLFVSQSTSGNRVSVFDVTTIADGEPAINVLGQTLFTTSTGATTQAGLNSPYGIAIDQTTGYLFVAQGTNAHRVSVFDVNAITDGEPAINVLGQSTFTGNASSVTQAGLHTPRGVTLDTNDRLYVTQTGANRISVFDISTIIDGEPAINVLGQAAFTINTATTTQSGLRIPYDLSYDPTTDYLYVAEYGNRRSMVFDVGTITDGENAVDVIGQTDGTNFTDPQPSYTKMGANDSPNSFAFSSPVGIDIDSVGHRLFLADKDNSRVLVFNLDSQNKLLDKIADNVIGEASFISVIANVCSQSDLKLPVDLSVDSQNQRLFVVDNGGKRVLIYDISNITNGMSATNVLGQPDFTTCSASVTQGGMSSPYAVEYDSSNGRLFVADNTSNRVTVYDVNTIVNGENAINVLGHSNFTDTASDFGPAYTYGPIGLAYDSETSYLYVSNILAPNILVFDTSEIVDGEAAINVLGQPDFTTNSTNIVDAASIIGAWGLAIDTQRKLLYAPDPNASRILVFDVTSITNGESAISVIGQADFTSYDPNITQSAFYYPVGVHFDPDNNYLYESDGANRVMIFDITHNDFIVTQSDDETIVTEDGTGDTLSIVLNRAPTTDVVIDLALSSTTEVTMDLTSLTFTNTNWNTPQTVTFTAVSDTDLTSSTATLTLSVNDAGSDDTYDTVANKTVTIGVDDSTIPEITVTPIDNKTGEDKSTGKINFVLSHEPSADVVIPLSSTNTAEGTVQSSITITPANWDSTTANQVTITGVDDSVPEVDGDITYTIVTGDVTSSDADFNALSATDLADISMENQDNDGPSITVVTDELETSEEGKKVIVQFILNTKPATSSEITIPLSISLPGEARLSTTALTISAKDWDTPENNLVYITGVDDKAKDGNMNYLLVTGDTISNDPNYDLLDADDIEDIELLNVDNEDSGIIISPASIELKEGESAQFTIALSSEPTGDVDLQLQLDENAPLKLSTKSLFFTNLTWEEPQVIEVQSLDYANAFADSYSVSISTAKTTQDLNFASAKQSLLIKLVKPSTSPITTDFSDNSSTLYQRISQNWDHLSPLEKLVVESGATVTITTVGWGGTKLVKLLLAILKKKRL